VKNVTFEEVIVNGKRMENIDGFITNEFIEGYKGEITDCLNLKKIY
jgi:hypothetical protein